MLKKTLFLFLILQSTFIALTFGADQQNYLKGWEAFHQNKYDEARKSFNLAITDPATKSDAYLSLCMLDMNEHKYEATFSNFRQFYESSSNPYPYLYVLSTEPYLYESDGFWSPEKLNFFEKIVADPKMNGTLKAIFYEQIGKHYQTINDFAKSKEWYAKMGAIDKWQVLGTFDNTSGSGFSKDWGAVTKAKPDDVFKNKVDAEVKWFTPTCNKPNNWFYFDYYFDLTNIISYAQSFVTSPQAQDVFLRAGSSGSMKIWVNDGLIASVPEERNCDLDIYGYKVHLNKGVNRILVQIGQSEINGANFLVRLTDAEANPIPSLAYSSTYDAYQKVEEDSPNDILPFFAEEFFTEKIKTSNPNPLDQMLYAQSFIRNDKSYEATKTLKLLEAEYPNSTLISTRLIEVYIRVSNQTDYDLQCEKIKQIDPNSFYGIQLRYNEAVKSEKYTDAETLSNQAIALYGANMLTDEWTINTNSYQKRYQELMTLAQTLYKKYPYRYDYMNLAYQIENNKNPKSATTIIEDYCNKYFNSDALNLLAETYIQQGNNKKGIETLVKRNACVPYATGYMNSLAATLSKMQKYKESLKVSDQLLAMAPYFSPYYNTRGYIYKNLNDLENAKDCFRKAIYFDPVSYDSRTQLRLLENKKEMTEYFPKVNLVELIAKAPSALENAQNSSVIVLNDNQLIVYPEGAKEYHNELAIKILNQSGIEEWKEYSISYESSNQKLIIDKAEVIKSNGQIVKAETNNDNYVVFTNLEVNDVLHLDYRIQDLSSGELAKHFFRNCMFQYDSPSLLNRYVILAPKNRTFQYFFRGGNVKPIISEVDDMKMYLWQTDNAPAVKAEPYMSAYQDVLPTLYYSSIPDWKYISNWYKDLSHNKFKSDYVLKETVTSLLKGKENATPYEKAKIFYNYILENITYSDVSFLHSNFVPQKASRTITTRLGDCKDVSTLYVALCREIGIDANLVLISTRNFGNKTMPLPAVDFNHCIAQLNLDGKVHYLELTNNSLPFTAALEADLGSEILPIPFADEPIGDQLLTLKVSDRLGNNEDSHLDVSLNNNTIQIDLNASFTAGYASQMRSSFRNVGSEDLLKAINQAFTKEFGVPVKVNDLGFENLENLKDSLNVRIKLDVTGAVQDVAGMKILKMPWTVKVDYNEVTLEETREYPLEFWSFFDRDRSTEVINFLLPKGKKFLEIPKDIKLECANAVFSMTFNAKTPGKLIATRTLERIKDQVSPVDYPAFQIFMKAVGEAENKQFAIQ